MRPSADRTGADRTGADRTGPDLTWPLEPLEIAAGIVLEPRRRERARKPPRHGPSAREALETLVLEALVEGRGSVSFSGGRDSSLILAVACHVARREGLPDPVAITMRHGSAESQESEWQERVVAHLGVQDWVKVDIDDRMDVLGEEATALLAVTGVQAPPNAYLHLPVVQAAPPGTVITGAGGDEILGTRADRLAQVVYAGARPRPRDLLAAARALAPGPLRLWWERRRGFAHAPWLTPAARTAVTARFAADEARVRLRWDVMAVGHARSRAVQLGNQGLDAVGAVHGCHIASPLHALAFVDAFAREVGPTGPASRAASMERLAHDLLPRAVLTRTSKAVFGAMVWGPRFRAEVEGRTPDDLPPEVRRLISPSALVTAWTADRPAFGTMMLAQQLWLSTARSGRGEVQQ